MRAKSQIWYTDFLLGFTIFILVVMLTIKYVTDTYVLPKEEINEMVIEA